MSASDPKRTFTLLLLPFGPTAVSIIFAQTPTGTSAKALGLAIPAGLISFADEVIE